MCWRRLWRLEFQKASTKKGLYLIAIGHTVAPRSNAPRLNITQYSLLTQVPSGNTSSGVASARRTCATMRSCTSRRSFTCALVPHAQGLGLAGTLKLVCISHRALDWKPQRVINASEP